MLTTAEEDRFEAALPLQGLAVEYEAPSDNELQEFEYDLTPHWHGPDAAGEDAATPGEYPAIVFDWDVQNQPEPDRQPLDDLHSVEHSPNSPALTETKTAEVSDELSITVAVQARYDDNGVPPDVRVSQLARQVWRFLRFELDLNSEGENGERPMRLAVPDESSVSPVRVEDTLRVEWPIAFHHAEHHEEEHETAEGFDFELTIE